MKLFDIIGGKVVIHSDALGIPCFKRVWDTDKPDKEHATKVISYIVLMNKWNSPYVQSMEADTRESKLKRKYLVMKTTNLLLKKLAVRTTIRYSAILVHWRCLIT